jgi:predicted nucleic acid-binding protein
VSTQQPIVVDTNILFSALLNSQSSFAEILLGSDCRFFVCEQVLVELFKRKEKLVKVSQLSEDEIVRIYQILLRRITLYRDNFVGDIDLYGETHHPNPNMLLKMQFRSHTDQLSKNLAIAELVVRSFWKKCERRSNTSALVW